MPDVVILVPRRGGFPDRDRLWSFARSWWSNDFPDVPIFEGSGPLSGPFNRGAALNEAAARAGSWDVAVLIDADVLIDPGQVRAAIDFARATDRITLAYTDRHHLTKEGTARILSGYRGSWSGRGFVKQTLRDACSSAVVVSRPLWDAVGGFDELFVGWGWEDVAFRIACETVSGAELVKIGGSIWHLWHVVSAENNRDEPTFQANKARGARYRAARWNLAAVNELLDEAGRARFDAFVEDPLPSTTIPRVLHRTVPAETDPDVDRWWSIAGDLHPGWTLRDWRDPLDPADWPETADLWPRCQSGAQRAGLIRLEALYREGGIYIDSDVELYRPLDPLLGVDAFAGWEDRKVVPDAVLGARPRHPAWAIMLERARAAILAGAKAWESGPGVTTSILPGRADVTLLPPGSFYPYHYTEKEERRGEDHATAQPWSFGAHHWRHSWAGR